MWTATVDFTKASDSITHKSIWKALKACDIKNDYISLLKKIHRDHKASVQTDEESNIFEIRKGTQHRDQKASVQTDEETNIFDIQKGSKQGDPMSSLLFNMVLQNSLKDDIQRWQKKKGMGIFLSDNDHDCLTNKKGTEKVGLRIHPEKTKILSNQSIINSDTKKGIRN